MFESEESMVSDFILSLKEASTPWGSLKIGAEFFYQRGRTDIVAVSEQGNVIAIEAKLSKWRIALQQAYRNRCFADFSYVLLPEDIAKSAYKNIEEFERRGVGICSYSEGKITWLYNSPYIEPVQPWLRDRAYLHAAFEGGIA